MKINTILSEIKWRQSLRITLIYMAFGFIWIFFSDKIIELFTDDLELINTLQTLKEWLFVVITALLFFQLSRREFKRTMNLNDSLLKSETKFRGLIEHSLVGFYLIQDNQFKFVNKRFEELFGYTFAELQAIDPVHLIVPDDQDTVRRNLQRRFEGEINQINYTATGIRKDGSRISLDIHGSRLLHDNKQALSGSVLDMTEQKKSEWSLEESEKKYRKLFEGMMHGYTLLEVIYDDSGIAVDLQFISANKAFEEQTGLKCDLVLGTRTSESVPGLEDWWLESYAEVNDTGNDLQMVKYAEPLDRWFKVSAYRYSQNLVAVSFDNITKLKKVEEDLQQHRENLEELVKERTAELEEKNIELHRFYDATVDREHRMKELRDEIDGLRNK